VAHILDGIAREKKADAVITFNVKPEKSLTAKFGNSRIPMVMIDGGPSDKVNCINLNNFTSGYKAVEYLIDKGRKKIIVTAGDPRYGYSQASRIEGCRKAFEDYGIEPGRYDILDYFLYSREDGIDAFEDLVSRKCDAIFCANGDHFALGLLEAAHEMEIDVPGDISVVGHDDYDISEALGITTIKQPITEIGEKAVEIVLGTLSGENTSIRSIVYEPELVVRRTA
jgi:DNA-binding LacI/PurR family transcriptional regulator